MVAVSLKKKLKGDSSRTHEVGQSHPYRLACISLLLHLFFFFKQKTAYEIGLGIPAEPLFRSSILVPQRYMPEMRKKADIVVGLFHSGVGKDKGTKILDRKSVV